MIWLFYLFIIFLSFYTKILYLEKFLRFFILWNDRSFFSQSLLLWLVLKMKFSYRDFLLVYKWVPISTLANVELPKARIRKSRSLLLLFCNELWCHQTLELIKFFFNYKHSSHHQKQTVLTKVFSTIKMFSIDELQTELMFNMAIYTEEAWTSLIQLTSTRQNSTELARSETRSSRETDSLIPCVEKALTSSSPNLSKISCQTHATMMIVTEKREETSKQTQKK